MTFKPVSKKSKPKATKGTTTEDIRDVMDQEIRRGMSRGNYWNRYPSLEDLDRMPSDKLGGNHTSRKKIIPSSLRGC